MGRVQCLQQLVQGAWTSFLLDGTRWCLLEPLAKQPIVLATAETKGGWMKVALQRVTQQMLPTVVGKDTVVYDALLVSQIDKHILHRRVTFGPTTPVAEEHFKIPLEKRPTDVQWVPNSMTFLVTDKTGDVYRFTQNQDTTWASELLLGHVSMVPTCLLSPDQKMLLTPERDEKIRVSAYPNAYVIHHYLLGHTAFVYALAFYQSGETAYLLSGGGGTEMICWDYRNDRRISSVDYVQHFDTTHPDQPWATWHGPERIALKQIIVQHDQIYAVFEKFPWVANLHCVDGQLTLDKWIAVPEPLDSLQAYAEGLMTVPSANGEMRPFETDVNAAAVSALNTAIAPLSIVRPTESGATEQEEDEEATSADDAFSEYRKTEKVFMTEEEQTQIAMQKAERDKRAKRKKAATVKDGEESPIQGNAKRAPSADQLLHVEDEDL